MAQQKISSSTIEEASSQSSTVHDDGSTMIEKAIKKTVDGIQTLLNPVNMTPEEEEKAVIKISEATQKHFELEIRTVQNAPRDESKLREILEEKQREYQRAEDSEVIERLVTEIEMLEYVLFLVRKHGRNSSSPS
jgi:hypothetical protein